MGEKEIEIKMADGVCDAVLYEGDGKKPGVCATKTAPVAAFPVTGPLDVIADHPIGALDTDLRSACIRALGMSREACRNFALERSWENSARQFIGNLTVLQPSRSLRPARRVAGRSAVSG